jgi:hypothetical protein
MKRPIPNAPKDRASNGVPLALFSSFEDVADVVDMLDGEREFDFRRERLTTINLPPSLKSS